MTLVPCHTRGHVLFHVTSPPDDAGSLFTGDTLFNGGCGKFFAGTPDEMLANFDVISTKFKDDTKIYCGHEYTLSNYKFCEWAEPGNEALKAQIGAAEKQLETGLCLLCAWETSMFR